MTDRAAVEQPQAASVCVTCACTRAVTPCSPPCLLATYALRMISQRPPRGKVVTAIVRTS